MPLVRRWSPPSSPRGYDLDIVEVTANMTIEPRFSDCILQVNSGSAVTITLPNNAPVGFQVVVEQAGAGAAVFAAASGATVVNRQSFDRTAGQYAVMGVYCRANIDGISASWNLTGDGADA